MKLEIYTIRDKKTDVYNTPFFQRSVEEAMRTIADAANDERTHLAKFPDDFEIYRLGSFNDNSGKIDPVIPTFVCSVSSLKVSTQSVEETGLQS